LGILGFWDFMISGIHVLFGSTKSNAEQFKNKSAVNVAIKPEMPEIYPRLKHFIVNHHPICIIDLG